MINTLFINNDYNNNQNLIKINLKKNNLFRLKNQNKLIKKFLIYLLNKNKYEQNKIKQIKNKLFLDFIKNKKPYELIINFEDSINTLSNQIEIDDLTFIKKNVSNINFLTNFSYKNLYEMIIEEKIKLEFKKINLKDYWDETLFGPIENYKIKYHIIKNNLVIDLDNKSFIIMYGTTQGNCYSGNNFIPSNIISKSTNSSGTIITHGTNGNTNTNTNTNTKDIYKESNGVIVKNDIKLGLVKPDNMIVWKVANIQGTKKNCIIKLRLFNSSKFIRPIDLEYIFKGKCRCDSAYVEEIQEYNFDNEIVLKEVIGIGIKGFRYEVGKIVYPDKWDGDVNKSCTNGIHVIEKRENLKKFMQGQSFNIENILDELS